jgi:hypothetical protein
MIAWGISKINIRECGSQHDGEKEKFVWGKNKFFLQFGKFAWARREVFTTNFWDSKGVHSARD